MGILVKFMYGGGWDVKWTLYSCRKKKGENRKRLGKVEKKFEWNIFTHGATNVWEEILKSLLKCKALMDSKGVYFLRIKRHGSEIVE